MINFVLLLHLILEECINDPLALHLFENFDTHKSAITRECCAPLPKTTLYK